MTLLVLLYHRAREDPHGNPPEVLDAHFAHIARSYPNVLPGEPLTPGVPNVCLSFDDGYYDFHATVYPLLRKHNLRALLAIPPGVVRERVAGSAVERLGFRSEYAFAHPDQGGLCTWAELAELASGGRVTIAAHGFAHVRLDPPEIDLAAEIDAPQTILRARCAQPVESFVFPFGRFSPRALDHARGRYRHVFRIGGASNRSWGGRLLYRIDADRMKSPTSLFAPARLAGYRARYFWNRLRGR